MSDEQSNHRLLVPNLPRREGWACSCGWEFRWKSRGTDYAPRNHQAAVYWYNQHRLAALEEK